ncbi:heat shock protein 70 family [Xylaria longipes]|nr:heat shock protein 70 family [Xylaria longipes]
MTIISDVKGTRFVPSCVAFTTYDPLIGKDMSVDIPEPVRKNVPPDNLLKLPNSGLWITPKQQYAIPDDQGVDTLIKDLPYKVLSGHQDKLIYKINAGGYEKAYTPEYVISLIMQKLKHMAEGVLGTGEKVTKAVVVVPPYFNDYQNQAIKHTGELAGLDILRTVKGARYPYDEHSIVVFDIGQTLDVSVSHVEQGVFNVLAPLHRDDIGGKEVFTYYRHNGFGKAWKKKTGIDLTVNPPDMAKLNLEIKKAKIALSYKNTTVVNLESIHPAFTDTLTRSEFEDLIEDLFRPFMRDAKLNITNIDDVVLASGTGNIPIVREAVGRVFSNHTIVEILKDEAAIVGVAKHGDMLSRFCDYSPNSSRLHIGIETADGVMAEVASRDFIPFRTSRNFTTPLTDSHLWSSMIRALKGERVVAANNLLIGKVELPLTPAPRVFLTSRLQSLLI